MAGCGGDDTYCWPPVAKIGEALVVERQRDMASDDEGAEIRSAGCSGGPMALIKSLNAGV